MTSISIGIREFRAKLADYVLHADKPIAVTRHGATVGYFIPAKAERKDADRATLRKAAASLDAMLRKAGFNEADLDEAVRDFRSWRKRRQ